MILESTAIFFGLLGSFHCLGMCGPIAFALPLRRDSIFHEVIGLSAYHTGRVLVYSILGLFTGLIASSLALFELQQVFSIVFGFSIILIVLFPRIFGKANFVNKAIVPVQKKIGTFFKKQGITSLFSIGLLNGLLPCGLVYMAIAASLLSGSALGGIKYMVLFGLGTIPMMSIIALGGNRITSKLRFKIKRFIPYVLIFFGIIFILRGLNLGIPYISPNVESHATSDKTCVPE